MSELLGVLALWLDYRSHKRRAWRAGLAVEDFPSWVARGSTVYRQTIEAHKRAEEAERVSRMAEMKLAADAERERILAKIGGVTQ